MSLKRKLYYSLSPQLRLLVRRLYFFPSDFFQYYLNKNKALIPPKGLIYTGAGDFIQFGKMHVEYFKKYAQLKPNHKVLDIGCGIGRTAVGLTNYLNKEGNYEGFDAMKIGIDWCNKNIHSRFSNFNFKFYEIQNDLYNQQELKASQFEFPYTENSFDFAFAMSVYTHMQIDEIEQYLKQTYKVLNKNGQCLATFFYYDDKVIANMNERKTLMNFDYDKGNYRLMDDKVTAANVAIDIHYLEKMITSNGFEIVRKIDGYWKDLASKGENDYQDMIVFKKV
ncbi:MAG: class I SAM-dependent methyltransferase [Bacteroidetes bacterium]|nr:class I SAM-dependent methyltransferase [Bacteroidota bacterium]